jgi:hypothetical protein
MKFLFSLNLQLTCSVLSKNGNNFKNLYKLILKIEKNHKTVVKEEKTQSENLSNQKHM